MPAQTRISSSAMAEIDPAFKAYCSVVEKSDFALSSQSTYHDVTNNFLRWLRYEFEPAPEWPRIRLRRARKTPQFKKKEGLTAENILEKIEELCRHRRYDEVRELAARNVSVLTQILHEYIQQTSNDATDPERHNRVRGAKSMLEHGGQ